MRSLGLAARMYDRICVKISKGMFDMGPISALMAVVVETDDMGSVCIFYSPIRYRL